MRVAVLAWAERHASGLGRGREDALRKLQLPTRPVREWTEGRPSRPAGKEREREGGPANGALGWVLGSLFFLFPFLFLFFF